jgi:hypothetical protein
VPCCAPPRLDPGACLAEQRRAEGCTVEEIGERLGYAPRSVKRKLQLIRSLWEKELTA